MTTQSLQKQYEDKKNLLFEMLEEGIIGQDTFDATLNKVKDETFFAVSVMADIDNLNDQARAA
jgi:hypothetical protein